MIETDPIYKGLRRGRRFVKVVTVFEVIYTLLALVMLYFTSVRAMVGMSIFLGAIVNGVFILVAGIYGATVHRHQPAFPLGKAFAAAFLAPLASAAVVLLGPRILYWLLID